MKRDKNRLITLLILLGILFLFAFLLKWAETTGAPSGGGSGIDTWREALWYLVVTLSTVGYGDFVPQTYWGKVIGSLFLLGSIGLFSWFVSLAISLLNGNFLPCIRLRQLGRRKWYLFSEDNPRSRLLAEQLSDEDSNSVIVICQCNVDDQQQFMRKNKHPILQIRLTYEDCLSQRKHDKDKVFLFLLEDDEWDNYLRAKQAAEFGCTVYCRSSARPDETPKGISLFCDSDAVGRLYWQDHPLEPEEQLVVLIGGPAFGEAVLEKGILNNVFSPDKNVSYHVFGDFSHFQNIHSRLKAVMKVNGQGADGDSLLFHDEPWEQCSDLLEQADRIILCADSDDEDLALFWSLKTYYPMRGKVYVRLTQMVEEPGMIVYGSNDELYMPQNVMNSTLVSLGIRVNELYRTKYGGKVWEELSEFHRQSSIASADHLSVKASILLGKTIRGVLTREDSRAAFEIYQKTADEKHDLYRWVEHERWMRFHSVYNWRYDEKRDNALRKHHLFLPFEQLSLREQAKDDDAWLLLGEYASGNM